MYFHVADDDVVSAILNKKAVAGLDIFDLAVNDSNVVCESSNSDSVIHMRQISAIYDQTVKCYEAAHKIIRMSKSHDIIRWTGSSGFENDGITRSCLNDRRIRGCARGDVIIL